jgi:hypothetical protein
MNWPFLVGRSRKVNTIILCVIGGVGPHFLNWLQHPAG